MQSDKNRVRINDDGIDIWKLDVHAELGISDHLLGLSNRGITLHGGDNNHVLTSNASTIDITQYVLKSVYDEKIAALEARIAALEAKHTETA
nr:MAG TPA: zipper dimerization domain transcription factor-like protein [Caudoviricetes sp.]